LSSDDIIFSRDKIEELALAFKTELLIDFNQKKEYYKIGDDFDSDDNFKEYFDGLTNTFRKDLEKILLEKDEQSQKNSENIKKMTIEIPQLKRNDFNFVYKKIKESTKFEFENMNSSAFTSMKGLENIVNELESELGNVISEASLSGKDREKLQKYLSLRIKMFNFVNKIYYGAVIPFRLKIRKMLRGNSLTIR
ncbi:hypothetical protein HXK64_03765, partial [Candidatus Gracilibacteria bacterium]|nr:hypothetical protein [Candidatus Gracilibacteria bacterium]